MFTHLSVKARELLAELKTELKGVPGIVEWSPGFLQELLSKGWNETDAVLAVHELIRAGIARMVQEYWRVTWERLVVFTFDATVAPAAGKPAVPVDQQHRAELAAMVQEHPELEPDVLIHHIEESDSTHANRNWHAAVNEARSFMDGLLVNIAMAESNHRREDIPGLPKSGERRSSFGSCRKYLQQIGLTQSDDDSRISAFYSDASKHGSHPRIVDEDTAKLLRDYCWSTGCYILAKYGRWKNNGHRW